MTRPVPSSFSFFLSIERVRADGFDSWRRTEDNKRARPSFLLSRGKKEQREWLCPRRKGQERRPQKSNRERKGQSRERESPRMLRTDSRWFVDVVIFIIVIIYSTTSVPIFCFPSQGVCLYAIDSNVTDFLFPPLLLYCQIISWTVFLLSLKVKVRFLPSSTISTD